MIQYARGGMQSTFYPESYISGLQTEVTADLRRVKQAITTKVSAAVSVQYAHGVCVCMSVRVCACVIECVLACVCVQCSLCIRCLLPPTRCASLEWRRSDTTSHGTTCSLSQVSVRVTPNRITSHYAIHHTANSLLHTATESSAVWPVCVPHACGAMARHTVCPIRLVYHKLWSTFSATCF